MGKHQSERGMEAWPLVASDLREVRRPLRVAKEVAGPKEEEGKEKGR